MAEKEFFGPLTLLQSQDKSVSINNLNEPQDCSCVLCDNVFTLPQEMESLQIHLFTKHKLVISDIKDIADLMEYLRYWRIRFKDESLPFFCTTMLLDGKPDGMEAESKEHYLLSDVLPEDKELRSNLQQTRLEKLLKHHEFEREDKNFEKECLFCRFTSNNTRSVYLKHLYEKHNFHIAKPENLIFIDDLIQTIATKLENLQCIFCEKYFKDRMTLKEHMRKKLHKRINSDNKEYDKYFLVNYLGEKQQKEINNKYIPKQKYNKFKPKTLTNEDYKRDVDSNVDSDPDWSEWTEENCPLITCLLCEHAETEYNQILDHMEKEHEFSFTSITNGFDFYHKIKVVNFIRHNIYLKQCFSCDTKFVEGKNLIKHMKDSNHFTISKSKWDQPEYYFPTYEDDLFLCYLQDDDESWWSSDEKEPVVSNDMSDISSEMAMAVLNDT